SRVDPRLSTLLRAAGGRAKTLLTCEWLLCAHERTHEAPIDLREHRFIGQSSLLEELSRVVRAVDARRFNVDVLESCARECLSIYVFLERASDAADPEFHAPANGLRNITTANDNIGDGKSPARLQHTERLRDHSIFVSGEIDHAIGDDHVGRIVRKGDV